MSGHQKKHNYHHLRLLGFVLPDFDDFPKPEQNPHAETLGEGGSIAGDTLPVRKGCPPLVDRLRLVVLILGSTPSLN